jgi:uncharacterized membrane protein YjjP (DUF1212 family)
LEVLVHLAAATVVGSAVQALDAFERVEVPRASVVVAGIVLAAAAVLLVVAPRRARSRRTALTPSISHPGQADEVTDFLVALGEAMVDAGDPVTHVQESLVRVASSLGAGEVEVVVMATALFVSVPASTVTQTSVASAGSRALRLDQVDDLFALVDQAEAGEWTARAGLERLAQIRERPAPFPDPARVLGYGVLTFGIALILRGSWLDVALATGLGLLVGVVEVAVRRLLPSLGVFLPVLASFGVATVVFVATRLEPEVSVSTPLIAPLVIFLPGALLTTAVIELSTGQMISGAGRLSAGMMRLVLLAIGIVLGAQVTGAPTSALGQAAQSPVPPWAPWVGVVLFGLGLVVHDCARPRSTGWILLVLYVAFSGQVVGGVLLGGVMSAFVGAVAMTPVALLAARVPTGPPAIVSFMPAFWLLVPGALGLVGVAKYLGQDRTLGAVSLLTSGTTMVAIALGVLLAVTVAGGVSGRDRR